MSVARLKYILKYYTYNILNQINVHGHIHLYQVGLHDTDTPLSEYIYYKAIPRCNVLATILDITSVTQGYKVLY